jgi:pimeloyl-ACP methyl ester carboxylesterase
MGAQFSTFKILHRQELGQWEGLPGFFSVWQNENDLDIERRTYAHNTCSLFKLQKYRILGGYRIVLCDYSSKRQITVIENCSSQPDARLAYETLVNLLDDSDLASPQAVERALRQLTTPIQGRFQHMGNPANNRFPEPMLQPINAGWNPLDFEADVVLVHGLDGDPLGTWTNAAGLWPIIWLLNSHHGIESMRNQFGILHLPRRNKIRVLTVRHRGGTFTDDLESDPGIIARNLVRLLFHAGVGSKPIIWLAHSLGGLIVKEILHFAFKQQQRQDLFTSTKGVVFFGTPHNGAAWAHAQRQVNPMRNSKSLFYLDPTPSIGVNAGNLNRLNELNQFFLRSNIPFLNFSEGAITPQIWLAWLVNIEIVSDAQARMNGPGIVEVADLVEQMALGTIPARVHYHYSDCHHLNIAKPSDHQDPTYRYTRLYVAHWIQRRPPAANLQGVIEWDRFAHRIVNTVRLYAVVIESINRNDLTNRRTSGVDEEQVSRVLIPLTGGIACVLATMRINDLLILIALFSGAIIAGGLGVSAVVAVVGGPLLPLLDVPLAGVTPQLAIALVTASLNGNVRNLLSNNVNTLREIVKVVNRYVMPDFETALATATSEKDLCDNHLREMIVYISSYVDSSSKGNDDT